MSTALEPPPTNAGKLAKASVNPVNLGIAAAGLTLAIGLGSLPIGILGGLAYAAMVAWDALGGDSKKKPKPLKLPDTLPDPKTIQEVETRVAVEKILAAKERLEQTLGETPQEVIANITTTLSTLSQLEAYAARLVQRAEDIARHLRTVDVGAVVEEVRVLTARAKDASHPDSRAKLEEAREARMEELKALKGLKATHDEIEANLARIVAVYGALPTKVVQLRALDAEALDRVSGSMNEELSAVSNELKTSENVIKNLETE